MISIDHDQIMIENYKALGHVDEHHIEIILKTYRLDIVGKTLTIVALNKYEIMIKGNIESIGFDYGL